MSPQPKEQKILRAAEDLFTGRRFHEVTMDDVCQKAGVGKGTIYRYFKDKEELFSRLLTHGTEELCAAIRAKADGGAPIEERLGQALEEVRRLTTRRRALFRILEAEEGRSCALRGELRVQWRERRKMIVEALAELFRKGIEAKVVRSDLPPDLLASSLLGTFRGFLWHAETEAAAKPSNAMFVDLFLNGAGSPDNNNKVRNKQP